MPVLGSENGGKLMAYYLVRATPKPDRLPELAEKLQQNAFVNLRPFGPAVSHGLNNAR
jgi:hypothetical protein